MFFDVLIHAPEVDFRGVRDPSDPSITNLFSPTRLVLQKPDERGNLHYVECQSDELSGEDAWDKFSWEIAKYIRGRWPEGFGGDHEYEMGSLQGTRIHLTESYYDEIGLPKLIDRGFPNSITVVPQLVLGKDIYGRIWCVSPTEPSMGFAALAFVLYQATLGHDLEPEEVGYCAIVFAQRYAVIWPSTNWTRWCCLGKRICHIQFHLRYFSVPDKAASLRTPQDLSEGLLICRQQGQIFSFEKGHEISFIERRIAVAINTSLDSNFAYYSMIMLSDHHPTAWLNDLEGHHRIELNICEQFIGIAIFQVALLHLLSEWNKGWNCFLNSIKIGDVLDLRKLEEFMPDRVVRERELFSLLRIQRAAKEWIYESVKDLENLVEDSNASTAAIAPKIVSGNWEALAEYQNGAKTRLLERIEKEVRHTETLIGDMKLFNHVG